MLNVTVFMCLSGYVYIQMAERTDFGKNNLMIASESCKISRLFIFCVVYI